MIIKKNIPSLLLEKFKKAPNSKSIGWIEQNKIKTITTKEYYETISHIILSLENEGLASEEKISILADTSHIWHFYDLASLSLNAVVVPIYPTYISSEILFILNHSESNMLVLDSEIQFKKILEIKEKLPNLKTIIALTDIDESLLEDARKNFKVISHSHCLLQGKSILDKKPERVEELINCVQDESLASIIYTSGTTGAPKGATIRHSAFWAMLDNVKLTLSTNIDGSDRSLTFLPLSHVLGRSDSMLHLALGLETIYAESIERLVDNIGLSRPTIMISVPRIFEKIYSKVKSNIQSEGMIKQKAFVWAEKVSNEYFSYLDSDQSPPTTIIMARALAFKTVYSKIYERFGGKIRFFVSGGAPLSVDIIKFLRNANLTILEGYGLTETIAPCCLNPIMKQIPGTVGFPLGDTQFRFASDGEILIKSTALFSEYYKNDVETKNAFEDGWFKTGDIGELTSEGYLKITDRKKDIIITSGGKNVAPQKIENLMKGRLNVAHFMVIGDKRKFLTAIVGIEKESFLPYLDQLGLKTNCTIEEIANNQHVRDMISTEIEEVNSRLAKFETIKKFYIAPIEFTPESGMITASLKLKKKELLKRFDKDIDAMYN
ncbi:hypothetical protein A9Q84_21500 [Halobacteriovorax marinus]|uniref:AMP-dependent synthetase/ligase domain-containing protein n=1 Tax=Halobacteriovorax marinus TaxID=97084 RepID=A0A1Y5F5Q4_9BACT|nr:hypothetical protein A9Q84_21500 [Halobacteriovorax marinus]